MGYVIGRLDRALRREISALVAPHGLSVAKYTALSVLRDRPGLSNAQLADLDPAEHAFLYQALMNGVHRLGVAGHSPNSAQGT
jgi:hypothetical protein